MYNIQDVYGWEDIDNKLHQIKINLHYSIWNHPTKAHNGGKGKTTKRCLYIAQI